MKNKKESKEKAVNEIKYLKVIREEKASFLNVLSSFGLAVVSTIIAFRQEKIDIAFCMLFGFSWVFVVLGMVSIVLLFQNMKNDRKYKEDYNYYVESKKLSDALLKAMKRTSFAKTNSILRSTYGMVPEWHPIDYCKNVLVYDVHEHLRDICIRIKELIVDLAPDEFNDDMVTVDIAFEYPSDKDFVRKRKEELESDKSEPNIEKIQDDREKKVCELDLLLKK
ncbi:MAG: hypothetical protein J6K04_07095 [Lachnospiraceae bacterium]|nr:hypothetical protein [Lachnospiraceae bacterium]